MSLPSGSLLKVILQNGASPNTGPFDIYVNSLTASQGGVLIANDVSKATLSGSGYEFTTPVETFSVLAKSDSSCLTTDIVVLGDIPGATKTIYVSGSYDTSLNSGLVTASVFLNNGYGLQKSGTIPTANNTCPATTNIGSGVINGDFNTLLVVKENETGSNFIQFRADLSTEPVYFYYIPAFSGSGMNTNSVRVCVDLDGSGNYVTTATNSINLTPTSSVRSVLSKNNTAGANVSATNEWTVIRLNGTLLYSSSVAETGSLTTFPGNAFVEVTSSLLPPSSWDPLGPTYTATSSLELRWNYLPYYEGQQVYTNTKQETISGSTQNLVTQYSFYAVPGAEYTVNNVGTISLPYPSYTVYIRLTPPTSPGDCTSGGLGYYNLQMNTFDFCTATQMTGNVTALTTNVHYVCYSGSWRQGFHSGTNNYLNGFGSCQSCP